MIVVGKKGKGFRGLISYILNGPADGSRDKRAVVIGSNMAGRTGRELAQEFGALRQLRPNLGNAVAHFSLNLPPDESISDEGFANLCERFLHLMGYIGRPGEPAAPYIIARHHDVDHEHCHIACGRIRSDGSVVSDKNDFRLAQKVARDLEVEFELVPLYPGSEIDPHEADQVAKSAMDLLESQQARQNLDAGNDKWSIGFGRYKSLNEMQERELRRDVFEPELAKDLQQAFRAEIGKIDRKPFGLELRFRDRTIIRDKGSHVELDGPDENKIEVQAARLAAIVHARGWKSVHFTGSPAFIRAAMAEILARGGIAIQTKNYQDALILERLMAEMAGGATGVKGHAPDVSALPAYLRHHDQGGSPAPASASLPTMQPPAQDSSPAPSRRPRM